MQRDLARMLTADSEVYRVFDTTLIPAIVRVRACRRGLFAGQAAFGRSASKNEWVYGFKVALSVNPEGVVTTFGLAPANCDERPIGEFLVASDGHDAYLADKGFSSVERERRWLARFGALVAATPRRNTRRAWPGEVCRWAASKRQLIEGVNLAAKGLLRPGAPPRQAAGRPSDPLSGQSGRLHLRAVVQRRTRATTTQFRRSLDLNNYAATVEGPEGSRRGVLRTSP